MQAQAPFGKRTAPAASAKDLIFGGQSHVPVLSGCGSARANGGGAPSPARPAGGLVSAAPYNRKAQEMSGVRRQRGVTPTRWDQYDSYIAAAEDHAFSKLHASLDKLERKAEKEHSMMDGAAGWSNERRSEVQERRQSPGGRRARSPARHDNHAIARGAGRGGDNSVAGLMSHVGQDGTGYTPRGVPPLSVGERGAQPGEYTDRSGRGGFDSERSGFDSYRGGQRSASPRGASADPRRATSPFRSSSPRAPSPGRRAPSPRPEWQN